MEAQYLPLLTFPRSSGTRSWIQIRISCLCTKSFLRLVFNIHLFWICDTVILLTITAKFFSVTMIQSHIEKYQAAQGYKQNMKCYTSRNIRFPRGTLWRQEILDFLTYLGTFCDFTCMLEFTWVNIINFIWWRSY